MNRVISGKWELYVGETEQTARARYERKWGRPAEEVKTVGEWMYLGPIKEGTDDQLAKSDVGGAAGL